MVGVGVLHLLYIGVIQVRKTVRVGGGGGRGGGEEGWLGGRGIACGCGCGVRRPMVVVEKDRVKEERLTEPCAHGRLLPLAGSDMR